MNSEHIKLVRFTILVSSVHCLLELALQLVIEVLVESFSESHFTADCSNLNVGISVSDPSSTPAYDASFQEECPVYLVPREEVEMTVLLRC